MRVVRKRDLQRLVPLLFRIRQRRFRSVVRVHDDVVVVAGPERLHDLDLIDVRSPLLVHAGCELRLLVARRGERSDGEESENENRELLHEGDSSPDHS